MCIQSPFVFVNIIVFRLKQRNISHPKGINGDFGYAPNSLSSHLQDTRITGFVPLFALRWRCQHSGDTSGDLMEHTRIQVEMPSHHSMNIIIIIIIIARDTSFLPPEEWELLHQSMNGTLHHHQHHPPPPPHFTHSQMPSSSRKYSHLGDGCLEDAPTSVWCGGRIFGVWEVGSFVSNLRWRGV